MDMANLPVLADKRSDLALIEGLADAIAAGHRPNEIARRLAPDDPAKRKMWRQKIWNYVRRDAVMAEVISERAQGELVLGLVPMTRALVTRASRGRPDAIKLAYEASGFHNPRVKHEHSGEIKVKLSMPRPTFEGQASEVTDAEVVD